MIFGNCRGKMGDVVFERSKEREMQRVHLKKHKANFSEKNLAVRARLALCAKAWNYYSKLGITNYSQREFCRKNFPRVSIVPREVYEYNESGCPFIDWQFRDGKSFLPYSEYMVTLTYQSGSTLYEGGGFDIFITIPFTELASGADYSYDFRGIQRYVFHPLSLLDFLFFNRVPNRIFEVWGYMLQSTPSPTSPSDWDNPVVYMQNGAIARTSLTDSYVRSFLSTAPSYLDFDTVFSKEEGVVNWFGDFQPSGSYTYFRVLPDFLQQSGKIGMSSIYCDYYYEGDDETPAFFDIHLKLSNFNPPQQTNKSTCFVWGWKPSLAIINSYVSLRQSHLYEVSLRNLDDWLLTWATKEEIANRKVYSV